MKLDLPPVLAPDLPGLAEGGASPLEVFKVIGCIAKPSGLTHFPQDFIRSGRSGLSGLLPGRKTH